IPTILPISLLPLKLSSFPVTRVPCPAKSATSQFRLHGASRSPYSDQKVTQFLRRTIRNCDKLQELLRGAPPITLCQVGRNGISGSSKLRHDSKLLAPRKHISEFIDFKHELMSLPPNFQVLKAFNHRLMTLSGIPGSQNTGRGSRSHQFLLYVDYQVPDVRAAVEQVVQITHDLVAGRLIRLIVQGLVPLPSGTLQLTINLGQFLLKILFRGIQTVFQGRRIAAR